MDGALVSVLLREVERQSGFGIVAEKDLREALAASDNDRVWYSIQALLVAAGNVSKLLWPAAAASADRGTALREALDIEDSSPLQPRTFRNHFEHFDERLEAWAKYSEHRDIVDSNIGSMNMVKGLDAGDCLRNFDTDKFAVTFRGDTYSLEPISGELNRLGKRQRRDSEAQPEM